MSEQESRIIKLLQSGEFGASLRNGNRRLFWHDGAWTVTEQTYRKRTRVLIATDDLGEALDMLEAQS